MAAKRELTKLARPTAGFDASRYFRGDHGLGFYNAGSGHVRALSREIYRAQRDRWTLRDALSFADALMPDRYLEAKAVGIEVVARYRTDFTPQVLRRCKRWLAKNHSANWATTDEICGEIIGPLLTRHPALIPQLRAWAAHRSLWVRRASIVGLLKAMRVGGTIDQVYATAKRLHGDPHDLIHKAVGWALREAGKVDAARLDRYLRANVGIIPRTTFRYAIERFSERKRRQLLALRP
ncbi:MAG TPA: DNA alkylation repair protein [Vicinamibacterales bacterium]|nr:DNA alkylation repair protein [Vicinamibacterales bacterium]